MEMPELNEDILEGESNSGILNQAEDSASLDESALQAEDQIPMEVDPKVKDSNAVGKPKEHQAENEDTLEDSNLQKEEEEEEEEEEPKENHSQKDINENKEEKEGEKEPAQKKLKLEEEEGEEEGEEEEGGEEEEEKMLGVECEPEQQEQLKLEAEQDAEPEVENQNQLPSEMEPDTQTEGAETQGLLTIKKENEEKQDATAKESEKTAAGPADTDMLATLASAALEQDPKDKTATVTTPKSPAKTEPETPKKKPEMWCNVGVFDTNTTIVSDYVATPEPNEHVDLVTATLGGRKIQLEPGTAYKFRVCAVNGCGTGPWSDVAAFKTTLPGFPGAPSAIKISKSPEGAHLTWEPPGGNSSEILEYAVYLAVRSASQGCQPVTTNQAQLAFVRVFCGPTNKCVVGTNSLQAAHIDTTTKPAIIFRIAARNSKGYGPATQVRWLQESQNGTPQGAKRAVKT